MTDYIVRRLVALIPAMLAASLLIFVLLRVLPGDVALARLSGGGEIQPDPEAVAELRQELGLDRPLHVQYLEWLRGMVTLDLGTSLWTGRPVTESLARWIPPTVEMALFALAIAAVGGISLGVLSALTQGSVVDYVARFISVFGVTAPTFWTGTLVLLLALTATGWYPPITFVGLFEDPGSNLGMMILPSLVAGFASMAYVSRMSRSAFLELKQQEFVRTATSKGLRQSVITVRHILPNMLPTMITVLGIEFAHLVSGVAIVEIVFNVPGLGRGLLSAIQNRDYVLVQSILALTALMVLLTNLVVDVVAARLDPRVRVN